MAMSNAERQARFRERRKTLGLKRQDAWRDSAGFPPAEGAGTETRLRIGYNQFIKELKELVKPMKELEAQEIYAELLRHARRLREGWDQVDTEIRCIVDEEKAARK
jgi:hypothetical protein